MFSLRLAESVIFRLSVIVCFSCGPDHMIFQGGIQVEKNGFRPVITICTERVIKIMPVSFSMANSPRQPRRRDKESSETAHNSV
jgi:hypothetical protein